MEDLGLVSIIMPSYNTRQYILEAIKSVQNQTYSNWELIIIDDCSNDGTFDCINNYLISNNEKRVKVTFNEKNVGAAISRNRALALAKGKWIAFLDSDDLWENSKLEKQLAFMIKYTVNFSYTNYCEINEEGIPYGKKVTGPKRIGKWGMYNYCWPGCLTVMYNADVVGKIQISDLKKNNDYLLWLNVMNYVKECRLLDETLAYYRVRNGSISNQHWFKLVFWHYMLFRKGLGYGRCQSAYYTINNLFFGLIKKIIYRKNME